MTATVRALCVLAALLQACSAGCIRGFGCGQTYPHGVSDLDLDLELDDSDNGLKAIYSAPTRTVEVLHYGDPCTCKKSHSYALEKPYPDPPEHTHTYGYDVQEPPAPIPVPLHNYDYRLEVPVEEPEPKTYTYGYEVNAPPPPRPVRLFNYDYKLELPVPEKETLLQDLVSEVDRVLLPRKDCNVERRSPREPLGWSAEDSVPGYYLADEDLEDDDVLHVGGPYEPRQISSSDGAEVHEQFHDHESDYKVLHSGGVYRETVNEEDDEEDEDASDETLELEGIPSGSVVHSAYYSGNQRGHHFTSDLRGPPATIDGIPRTRYYRASRGEYSDDQHIQTPNYGWNQLGKSYSGNHLSVKESLGDSLVYPRTLNQKSIDHLNPGSNNRITGALYLSSGNRILQTKGESELDEYSWGEFNEQNYPEIEVNRGKYGTESKYAENDDTYEEPGSATQEHSTYRDVQSLEDVRKNWGASLVNETSEKNNQFSGCSSDRQTSVEISNAVNDVSKATDHEKLESQGHGVYDVTSSVKDVKSNNIKELGDEPLLNSDYPEREIVGYGDAMTLQEGVIETKLEGIAINTDESLLKQIVPGKEINDYGNVLMYDKINGAISHETNADFGEWKMYWDKYEPTVIAKHLSEPPDSDTNQEHIDSSRMQEYLHMIEDSKYLPDAPSGGVRNSLDGINLQYRTKSSPEEGKEYVIHHDFDMLEGKNYHDKRTLQKENPVKYENTSEKEYPSYSHLNEESDSLLETYDFKPLSVDIEPQRETSVSGFTTAEMAKYYLFNEDYKNLVAHSSYAANVFDSKLESSVEDSHIDFVPQRDVNRMRY